MENQIKEPSVKINFKPSRFAVCFAIPDEEKVESSIIMSDDLKRKILQEKRKEANSNNNEAIAFEIIKVGDSVEEYKIGDIVYAKIMVGGEPTMVRAVVEGQEFLYMEDTSFIMGWKIYNE